MLAAIGAASPARADSTLPATITNYKYQPNPMTVAVGDIVIWTNNDPAQHDVTSTSGPTKLASPELNQNDQWGYKFTQPGTYSYYCTLHPDMRATLTVVAARSSASATTITTAAGTLTAHATTTPRASTKAGSALSESSTTAPPSVSTAGAEPADPAGVSAQAPVATTDTSVPPTSQLAAPAPASSSSSPRINPLLFLAAVAAGIVVFSVLVVSGPGRGSDAPH